MRTLVATIVLLVLVTAGAADAGSREPVYVYRLFAVYGEPRIRPPSIVLNVNGNWTVRNVRWRGWGTPYAHGLGTAYLNNCIPDCARGFIARVPARITLFRRRQIGNRRMYVCVSARPLKPGRSERVRYCQ